MAWRRWCLIVKCIYALSCTAFVCFLKWLMLAVSEFLVVCDCDVLVCTWPVSLGFIEDGTFGMAIENEVMGRLESRMSFRVMLEYQAGRRRDHDFQLCRWAFRLDQA
jgi:hypothetical protein